MRTYRSFMLIATFLMPLLTLSQPPAVVSVNKQKTFQRTVSAGDYSGITWLGGNRYAVVSDKSDSDGFFIFSITIDSVSGKITSVVDEGFFSSGNPNRDMEGIAFFPPANTVFICGERDNMILEYTLDGHYTGRRLAVPEIFSTATANYGFESLAYDAVTRRFWTTTESTLPGDGTQASPTNKVRNRLRLQSFCDSLEPSAQYFYEMDEPVSDSPASVYAMEVSELCALDDGRLLVLEREFHVPPRKLGAYVICKLYSVNPAAAIPGSLLDKTELLRFRTRLTLFGRALANYEGMCLGPRLHDGRRVLVLVSDSQHRYKGVLKDWFKTVVIDDTVGN